MYPGKNVPRTETEIVQFIGRLIEKSGYPYRKYSLWQMCNMYAVNMYQIWNEYTANAVLKGLRHV